MVNVLFELKRNTRNILSSTKMLLFAFTRIYCGSEKKQLTWANELHTNNTSINWRVSFGNRA